jgi:oxalate decarboxylase/phosphoglucose isomerase-like protein (cupin superfamily)
MTREIRAAGNGAEPGALVALHITHDVVGTKPASEDSWPLQLLLIQREAGSTFQKHIHTKMERTTGALQEGLVVIEGRIRATLCTRDGVDVGTLEVRAGECLFLVDGGWAIEVLEGARMYEFKNGPYLDDKVML